MKQQRLTVMGSLLAAGLVLSVALWFFFSHLETNRIQRQFQSDVTETGHAFIQAMNAHFEALYSLQLTLDTQGIPDAEGFETLTGKILRRYPAITALEWIPEVPQEQRDAHEAQAARWLPGYVVTEQVASGERVAAGERSVYYPALYVAPMAGNEAVIGYDLGAHAFRFEAVQRARDSGRLQLTVPLQLRHQGESQGILSLLPVYEFPEPMSSVERQESLIGFVGGVFSPAHIFLSSAGNQVVQPFSFTLIDTLAPAGNRVVFSLVPEAEKGLASQQTRFHYVQKNLASDQVSGNYDTRYRYVHQVLTKGGRRWVIEAMPRLEYIQAQASLMPWWIFGGVNLLFILAATVLFFVFKRDQQTYDQLTAQHDKLRAVNEKLERLSLKDPLTGIANQRAFEESLDITVRIARRDLSPMALLVIQIDDVAMFANQLSPEQFEDSVRRLAAELSRTLKRPADVLARLDDDRFVAILPNTNNGEVVARQLRTAAERLNLAEQTTHSSPYLTISIGALTVFDLEGLTAESVFHFAESQLQAAQQEGHQKLSVRVIRRETSAEQVLD
ncbi:CHASE domain-containing protein [Photobacterium sp. GJ3]|uniref:CHASE domain-containing protein n=1 Tax=Photobacterium sp. GJ3 TaxID=2829502 RepID=UPI001B8D1187|nr:CHASE domain-containing protein [Photobacterium sp. GJ3]QUJ66219.1 CHASE domain-containing protein [Photobacterium sp. GJ3]